MTSGEKSEQGWRTGILRKRWKPWLRMTYEEQDEKTREGAKESQALRGSQRKWGRLRRSHSKVRMRTKKEWYHETEGIGGRRALEGECSQKSKILHRSAMVQRLKEIHWIWQPGDFR